MRYDARPQCRGLVLSSAACQAPNTDVIAAGCVHAETKKKKAEKKEEQKTMARGTASQSLCDPNG